MNRNRHYPDDFIGPRRKDGGQEKDPDDVRRHISITLPARMVQLLDILQQPRSHLIEAAIYYRYRNYFKH